MAITYTGSGEPDAGYGDNEPFDKGGQAVTPSDTAKSLNFIPRALMCAASGNVCVIWKDGTNSILSIVVGIPLKVRPLGIAATGTTATGIVALK